MSPICRRVTQTPSFAHLRDPVWERACLPCDCLVTVPAEQSQQPLSLLVVEDNEQVAWVIRAILQRSGHTVTVARTLGAAARTLMDGLAPDAVVAECLLADGDGLAYASRLGAERGIGVVVMSGGLLGLLGLPASDDIQMLPKPFTPDQLEDSLQRCLAGSAADRAA